MPKWYEYKAHWAVRGLAILNMVGITLFSRYQHYLVNEVTGNLKAFGALLVAYLEFCPSGLVIFFFVGLAQLGKSRPSEEQFKKEQLSLYIDGVLALAAYLVTGAWHHPFVQM